MSKREQLPIDGNHITEDYLSGLKSYLYIDPITVIEIIQSVAEAISKKKEADAENRFRQDVLSKLDQIDNKLDYIRQQIVELGVLLALEIRNVPIGLMMAELRGATHSASVALPSLKKDHQRSRALFDHLGEKIKSASEYGAAVLPAIATGVVLLPLIHRYAQQKSQTLDLALKDAGAYLSNILDEKNIRGLRYQRSRMAEMLSVINKTLSEVQLGVPIMIGTHNYGWTWLIETIYLRDGWYCADLKDEDKPRPPHDPIDRPDRPGRWVDLVISENSLAIAQDPVSEEEIILYTTGVRPVPITLQLTGDASHPNTYHNQDSDQHRDEWVGHVATHVFGLNVNKSMKSHIEARITALNDSIRLAEILLDMCKKRISH